MSVQRRLMLLMRPDCHLCEEFEQEFAAHFGAQGFVIQHAEVDSNPEWQRRYGLKIPVLLDEQGVLLGQAPFDADIIAENLGKPV